MTLSAFLIFFIGIVIIVLGAEVLLRGASRIAAMLGVKPMIIGLTVVAIGTSAPELAVGITAATEGKGSLAVGNIAGTNMFNILFILGLSAVLRPLPLHLNSIKLDVPVMIVAALMLIVMSWNNLLSHIDGWILILGAIAYTVAIIRNTRKESAEMRKEYAEEYSETALLSQPGAMKWSINILLLIAGMVMTVWGANMLVEGAVEIARGLGVSEAVIGLTIVAIGTSAPELVTTIVATRKNDRDVAVGNLIGSSITNILVILGVTCVISPGGIDVSKEILRIDLPLAAAVAIICYPVFRSDKQISRMEGMVFVALYIAYMSTLVFVRA